MSKSKLAIASKIVGGIFAAYVLLSLNGGYQPSCVGASGVKWYEWAPFGFYDPDHAWEGSSYAVHHPTEKTGGWNRTMMWTFLPLYYVDDQFIHKMSYDGKTPAKE
jgi:hypothetical protein